MATSLSNETQTTNHTQTMATPKVKMMDASVGYSPPSSKSNSIAPRIIKPSKQVSPIISTNYSRQDQADENNIGYHSIGLSAYNRKQAVTGTQILGKGGEAIKSGLGSGYMNKYDDDDEEGCGRSSSQEGSFSNGIYTVDRDRTEGGAEGGGSTRTLQWNHVTPNKLEYSLSNQYSEVPSKQQYGNGSTQSDSAQNKQGGSSNAKATTAAAANKNLNSSSPRQQVVSNNKKQQKGSGSKNNNRGDTNSSAKKEWSSKQEASNDSQTRNSSSPNRYASSLSNSGGPSSMIQSAGLAYPFLYPNTYHLTSGFPSSPAAATHQSYSGGYSGSGSGHITGSGLQSSQQSAPERNSLGGNIGSSSGASGPSNSTSGNSRRGGKKKAPLAAQAQNPEFRLFFNLRRRDQAMQSNKGSQAHHHHVYKLKNPLNLQEWFKKLTVEERVNSLSTVCPHLTETFINMVQRMDSSLYGQSSCFARIGPHNSPSELKYYGGGGGSSNGYSQFGGGYSGSQYSSYFQDHSYSSSSNSSYQIGFDDLFYHRQSSSEYEQRLRNSSLNSSERAKNEAEQEILKHVRLTDYYQQLDTLTVNEELVLDPDYFFKLMSLASANQAFTSVCQFELRPSYSLSHSSYHHQYHQYGQPSSSNQPPILVVDQPSWFKPKSFHSFVTWVIVALEENLWAHYNYESGQNMSAGIKSNDLQSLFRERSDSGTMDIEMGQLAAYWRECPDKDRKALIKNLRQQVVKDWEMSPPQESQQAGGSIASQLFKSKVMQSKNMSYSLSIKERPQSSVSNAIQEQVDFELRGIIELAMRPGSEFEMISSLMYTPMDRFQLKIYPIQRKLLELIKKKYKDDLMENLLQEEYSGTGAHKGNSSNSNNLSNQLSNNLAQSKSFKKKKKKQAKQAAAAQEANQSSGQEPPQSTTQASSSPDQSALDISTSQQIQPVASQEDPGIQQQSQQQQKKKKSASNASNPHQHGTSTGNIQSKQNAINNQEHQHKDVNNLMQDKTGKTNMTAAASNKKKKTNNNNTNTHQPGSNHHSNDTNLAQSSSASQQLQQQNQKISPSSKHKQQDQKQLQQNKIEVEGVKDSSQLPNQDTNTAVLVEKDEEIKDSQAMQSTVVLDQSPSTFPSNETFKNNDDYDSDGQIRAYLLELTNFLVTEVCKRAASASDQSENLDDRSMKLKQEAKDNNSNLSSSEPLASHINKNEQGVKLNSSKYQDDSLIEQQLRPQSPHLHNQQAQAKDNAKQQEITQKKKSQNQQMNNQKPAPPDEAQANQQQQKKQPSKPQQQQPVSQAKVEVANAVGTETSGVEQSAQVKKKRNKKKSKLTDTDIMNNFMKSLHQHADDEQSPNVKKANNSSEQQKKRPQQAWEEDPKKKNNAKTGGAAPRKYTEDNAVANDQEDRKNKGHQKKPMIQQKKKQPSPTMNEDQNHGAEEVKDIVMGMVEKVSSQIVVLDEESKHEEDIICDITVKEDSAKVKSEKVIDITDLSAADEPKHQDGFMQNSSSGGVDPKVFYQNFPQFIPSSISTTNSQGDQQSLDNDQTAAENNNCLTDCEIKEETKQSSIGGATGSSAAGINQNYRTPPQSSKKQDVNQLSQQSIGIHHFASGEGINMQSFSANSGSTLSNNFKRLPSQPESELQNFIPTTTGNENYIQPGGVQSTFGGLSHHQFYGNFQSFGYNGSNNSSAQEYPVSTFQQPQNYPPVPLTPPVPSNFQTQTLGNSSVFFPQSSRSPNLQNSHSMIFPNNQTTHGQPTLLHSQSSQYHSSSSHSNKNNRNYNNGNKVQGHYQRPHAQRGVPGRSHNNNSNGQQHQQQVQLQIMNLSQSMQEQMQAHHQNPYNYHAFQPNMMDSQNIFYHDQSAAMGDNYGFQKQQLNDHQVFPYLMEKSNSVNVQNNPLPCYSPQQQQQYSQQAHFQPSSTNEAVQNPFGQTNTVGGGLSNLAASFRPSQNSSLQSQSSNQPYSDQSQDQIIFQIVNSIKSNLSTSPVPQQITSPPLPTHDQMSHHSSEHQSSEHIDPMSIFYDHLDQEIQAYVNQIQDNLNLLKPEREFVISKLQEVVARAFDKEQPKIEIFGSIITGLALESSDLDLAVTGLRIDDRLMMIDDLQILAKALQSEWKSIESFKAIETASIPVIKMKVDLFKLREQEMKEREDGDFLMRPIPDNQRYLSVDITFDDTGSTAINSQPHSPYMNNYMMMGEQQQETQTQTHLGLASCRLVQWYIQSYRNLRQLAILMKKFLAIHNLNSPYYGGLSSYSTVILIVAFMNYHGLRDDLRGAYYNRHENVYYTQDEMTPARLLMCFLDFYSYIFNPNMLGISVVGNGSFFPLNGGPNSSGNIAASVQGLTPHSLFIQGSPIDQLLMNPGGLGGFSAIAGLGSSNSGGSVTVSSTSNMMILDPLNTQNNTTKNSFLTKDILKQFNSALSSLKTLIGNSTQSPGITQSPLAQFLKLDQSPLQQAPSSFTLLTGYHASQFLPQSEVESSSLPVDRANTAEAPTLPAVSSSSQNQQTVESVDAPSFKATIDNCMPGSFGYPKLPPSTNPVGAIQVVKHLNDDKASEDDLVLKISEEIKRDSQDIKKVELLNGMVASRDQGIKGQNQDQERTSHNSQLPKVKTLVDEHARGMEAGKVRNYESHKDGHQAKKQQQVVASTPVQSTALKQHSSKSSTKSLATTEQKKHK